MTKPLNENKNFNIDIDSFTDLPIIVFWKDLDNRYYGCSDGMCKLFNIQSTSEVIGLRDDELQQVHAEQLVVNDEHVMQQEQPITIIEPIQHAQNAITQYVTTIKSPLYDYNDKLAGVFGVTFDGLVDLTFTQSVINKIVANLPSNKKLLARLTERELQCLQLLCEKSLAAREIAAELGISRRTVENYFENIKIKLGCKNKLELTKLIVEHNLL